MNKDYNAVDKLYKNLNQSEFIIVNKLNSNMPNIFIRKGFLFEINIESQYAKNDINFVHISPDRKKETIVRVEFEYGEKQEEWLDEFPKHYWNRGLSLVSRKKYGETFDLFIKSSLSFESFFAIDCKNNFIKTMFGDTEQKVAHNLGFSTNSDFFNINWNEVDKCNYSIENTTGEICIVEKSNYKKFYGFLYHKFLNKKYKNLLHY